MDLKLLASNIAEVYMQNPKVAAVLLGGSVSRNWQDNYSDIELFVLWNESPVDHDRKRVMEKVHGNVIDFHPYEEEEWSETYIAQGVKLEISSFLTETIEKAIEDVTERADTHLDKQCLVAAVHDGLSLEGSKLLKTLQKKTKSYPDSLSRAMILEYSDLGTRWQNREALLQREDWLMLYNVIVSVQTHIMGMLFGLNRLYVHHPAFKWQRRSLEFMPLTPKNISNRFESSLLDHPKTGVREMEKVIEDMHALINSAYPEMKLHDFLYKSLFLRPENEADMGDGFEAKRH